MKYIISILLALSATGAMAKDVVAPYGFTWGQTEQELVDKGVPFITCMQEDVFTVCMTKHPLKPVSYGQYYTLMFDPKKGLQKILMTGPNLPDDKPGKSNLYNEVQHSVSKLYKPLESYKPDPLEQKYIKLNGNSIPWATYWGSPEEGMVSMRLDIYYVHGKTNHFIGMAYESKDWYGIKQKLVKQRAIPGQ